MAEPLFTNCAVPFVPIVDFDFIDDCQIPTPPPPIFDCAAPICPPFEVPPFCPDIKIGETKVTSRRSRVDCSSSSSATVELTVTQGDNCSFEFGLNLDVPVIVPPCPAITGGVFRVVTGYEGCVSGDNKVTVTPGTNNCDDPDAPCEFEINLDLVIPIPKPPCPDIGGGTVRVVTGYAGCVKAPNRIYVNKTTSATPCGVDDCAFDINLELFVPIPKPPCPDINGGEARVTTGYEGCVTGTNKVNVIKTTYPSPCGEPGLDECSFDITLDLVVPIPKPPCPDIDGGPVNVVTGYEGCVSGVNRIKVTKTTSTSPCGADECAFDIALDLFIPVPKPPCPDINGGVVTVTSGYADCISGTNNINVRKTVYPNPCSADECAFDIDLNLVIPIPRPPCPEINPGPVNVQTGYRGCVNPGDSKIIIDKRTYSSCDGSADQCEFDISLDLVIPVPKPVCPLFRPTTKTVNYSTAISKPDIQFQIAPDTTLFRGCDGEDICAFNIDVVLDIPQVNVPCPEFYCKETDCKHNLELLPSSGEKRAVLTIDKQPKKNCIPLLPEFWDEDCYKCEFLINLDLAIPAPPCPEIKPGKVSITEIPVGQTPTGTIKISDPPAEADWEKSCEFEISLDLSMPVACIPRFWSSNPDAADLKLMNSYEQEYAKLRVEPASKPSDPSGCDFYIEMGLGIPAPPCSSISPGAVNINYSGPYSPSGSFDIAEPTGPANWGDPCAYTLGLTLDLPPSCIPAVAFLPADSNYDYYDNDFGIITGPNHDPANCRFEFQPVIRQKKTCIPSVSFTTADANYDDYTNEFAIVPGPGNDPANCKFEFKPVIRQKSNSIALKAGSPNVTKGSCGSEPTLDIQLDGPDAAGEYTISLKGAVPDCSECCPIDSEVSLAPKGLSFTAAPDYTRESLLDEVALPRFALTAAEYVTGDKLTVIVKFEDNVRVLNNAIRLVFSIDNTVQEELRFATLVPPAPNALVLQLRFEYTIQEADIGCKLCLIELDDVANPYYTKLANNRNRKVVKPFPEVCNVPVVINFGCSSSSSDNSSSGGSSSSYSSSSKSSGSSGSSGSSTGSSTGSSKTSTSFSLGSSSSSTSKSSTSQSSGSSTGSSTGSSKTSTSFSLGSSSSSTSKSSTSQSSTSTASSRSGGSSGSGGSGGGGGGGGGGSSSGSGSRSSTSTSSGSPSSKSSGQSSSLFSSSSASSGKSSGSSGPSPSGSTTTSSTSPPQPSPSSSTTKSSTTPSSGGSSGGGSSVGGSSGGGSSGGSGGSTTKCPGPPTCPPCYSALVIGKDGDCLTWMCMFTPTPGCFGPGSSSSITTSSTVPSSRSSASSSGSSRGSSSGGGGSSSSSGGGGSSGGRGSSSSSSGGGGGGGSSSGLGSSSSSGGGGGSSGGLGSSSSSSGGGGSSGGLISSSSSKKLCDPPPACPDDYALEDRGTDSNGCIVWFCVPDIRPSRSSSSGGGGGGSSGTTSSSGSGFKCPPPDPCPDGTARTKDGKDINGCDTWSLDCRVIGCKCADDFENLSEDCKVKCCKHQPRDVSGAGCPCDCTVAHDLLTPACKDECCEKEAGRSEGCPFDCDSPNINAEARKWCCDNRKANIADPAKFGCECEGDGDGDGKPDGDGGDACLPPDVMECVGTDCEGCFPPCDEDSDGRFCGFKRIPGPPNEGEPPPVEDNKTCHCLDCASNGLTKCKNGCVDCRTALNAGETLKGGVVDEVTCRCCKADDDNWSDKFGQKRCAERCPDEHPIRDTDTGACTDCPKNKFKDCKGNEFFCKKRCKCVKKCQPDCGTDADCNCLAPKRADGSPQRFPCDIVAKNAAGACIAIPRMCADGLPADDITCLCPPIPPGGGGGGGGGGALGSGVGGGVGVGVGVGFGVGFGVGVGGLGLGGLVPTLLGCRT